MTLEVPPASSQAVHNVMVANKSTNTKPELIVRRLLRDAGFPGYRLHWRVDEEGGRYICRPDISFPGRKLAIFVHGCFWHRHEGCSKAYSVKTDPEGRWRKKFEQNVERDRRVRAALRKLGWKVIVVWECTICEPGRLKQRFRRRLQ